MTIATMSVASLKVVKNSVIGNRTAKGAYGRDEAFVSKYVPLRGMARPRTEGAEGSSMRSMIPLFLLLPARNLAHGVIPAPPGVVRFATGWAGTLIAVAYVAVAGSVFVQFLPAFTGF